MVKQINRITIFILLLIANQNIFGQNINITSFYEGPFEDVVKEAKRTQKPILLDFTAKWCKHCMKMETEVFANAEIAEKLNSEFIAYKVDIDEADGKEISNKYLVKEYPTYLILDPTTQKSEKIKGFYTAPKFKKEIDKIMDQSPKETSEKKKRKLFGRREK